MSEVVRRIFRIVSPLGDVVELVTSMSAQEGPVDPSSCLRFHSWRRLWGWTVAWYIFYLDLVSVRWLKSVCRVLLDFIVVVGGDLKSFLQLDLSASLKGLPDGALDLVYCGSVWVCTTSYPSRRCVWRRSMNFFERNQFTVANSFSSRMWSGGVILVCLLTVFHFKLLDSLIRWAKRCSISPGTTAWVLEDAHRCRTFITFLCNEVDWEEQVARRLLLRRKYAIFEAHSCDR